MKEMGIKNKRKPKRRTHTRKLPSDSSTDMAEARREIVNALHLHRSSSWLPSYDTKQETIASLTGNNSSSQLYYPLVEPQPEPTWSMTEPAAAPPPIDQVLEFEWPENSFSSSYTWWLGFLRSLDSGKEGVDVDQPSSSEYYYSCQENGSSDIPKKDMVCSDQREMIDQSREACEWLTVAAAEDEVEVL